MKKSTGALGTNIISSIILIPLTWFFESLPGGASLIDALIVCFILLVIIMSNFMLSKWLLKDNMLEKRELLALNMLDLFLLLPNYIKAIKIIIVESVNYYTFGFLLLPYTVAFSITVHICLRLVNSFCSYKRK